MIRLRRLQPQDADRMLEWMHDPDSVAHMQAPFARMTAEDCRRFIASAAQDTPSLHRAAVDEADRYLGTVSLKNIQPETRRAEFAIAMHPDARGTGASAGAMQAILQLGFAELGLHTIYWCVDAQNARARRFYAKQGYATTAAAPDDKGLFWYEITHL